MDAVRTHSNASAIIDFKKGSRLELNQNTLVIIRDSADSGSDTDQAVFRGGQLVSHSRSELWLLTSAALLKIRAKSEGQPASAIISGKEGQKMRFELSQGDGVLIRRSTSKLESIPLHIREAVTLDAPRASVSFGRTETQPLAIRAPQPSNTPTVVPPKPELSVSEPVNYQEVHAPSVVVKGKASPSDARVLVNGREARLSDGAFSAVVPIDPGESTVVIELVPKSGTPLFRKISIVRKE